MGNVRNRPFEKVAAPSETLKGLLRATGIEPAAVADDGSNAAGNGRNSSEWLRAGKQRRCQNLPDTKDVLNFWRHPKKENAEPPSRVPRCALGRVSVLPRLVFSLNDRESRSLVTQHSCPVYA